MSLSGITARINTPPCRVSAVTVNKDYSSMCCCLWSTSCYGTLYWNTDTPNRKRAPTETFDSKYIELLKSCRKLNISEWKDRSSLVRYLNTTPHPLFLLLLVHMGCFHWAQVIYMRCAWTCFLIKTSFLIYSVALSGGLWGGGDFLHRFTQSRWFWWAPVASQWSNSLIHSFSAPISSTPPPPPPTSTHIHASTRWSRDGRKSIVWPAEMYMQRPWANVWKSCQHNFSNDIITIFWKC